MFTNDFTSSAPYAILILSGIMRMENRSVWSSPSEGQAANYWDHTFLLCSLRRRKGNDELGLD